MCVIALCPAEENRTMTLYGAAALTRLLILWFFLSSTLCYGREPQLVEKREIAPEQHEVQQKEVLGSLSSVGEVYVNDLPAPAASTIFTGDKIRTGNGGTATFTVSGDGTLKISPQSQVTFSGSRLFTAELDAGTVVLTSVMGGKGIILRIGDFVLVPSFPREQSITSKIDRTPDGSFLISCLDGSEGVLTLQGRSGQFLHAGQAVRASFNAPNGNELSSAWSPGSSPEAAGRRPHRGWLLLSLAGVGGVADAIDHLAQGGGKQSVSPSVP